MEPARAVPDVFPAATQEPLNKPAPATAAPITSPDWPFALRIAFRFCVAFLLWFDMPFPIGFIPGTATIAGWYNSVCVPFVRWIGQHVLLLPDVVYSPNGSGDTTFDWVFLFTCALLAAVTTIVWSVVDRRRRQYRRLHEGARIYFRYYLGAMILSYGLAKIFKTQFPYPSPDTLLEPYGESSPMHLLWTFMGYSLPYNVFTGLAETVGGILLFFRRTTLVGALVLIVVMTNVVILNFCYDVPVKIFSSILLAHALFLTAPDAVRLGRILLAKAAPRTWIGWRKRVTLGLKLGFLAVIVYVSYDEFGARIMRSHRNENPMAGVWRPEEITRDGVPVPLASTDATLWRTFAVSPRGGAIIRNMDGSARRYDGTDDRKAHTLKLEDYEKGPTLTLSYVQPAPDQLVLDGEVAGHTLHVKLRKQVVEGMLLMNRGFHWVNEAPFNR